MNEEELKEVALENIRVNPFQPRRHFSRDELEELASSFDAVGIIQPPVVRPLEGNDRYELVSGERRFRAAQLAGYEKIPVLIRESSRAVSAEAALVENIQRVDLNPLEIARAFKSLVEEFGYNQETVAKRVGKKRSSVANYLRLLTLPKDVQDSLVHGQITMGHAKAILSLSSFEKQKLLHQIVIRDELSVRETEKAAETIAKNENVEEAADHIYSTRDVHIEQLMEKLQNHFGTKVNIQGKGNKGKISIDYYDLDDLDRILELIGLKN